ncbi:MAG: thiamine diphosphokinase [Rhodobacterales bacterium]|nr:MAG: thiamine diphosphokinase [Rhodobacterales bacterium]
MEPPIFDTSEPTVLLGGADFDPAALKLAFDLAPNLVAADSGADSAIRSGRMPDAVIGDFDSVDPASLAQIPRRRQHRVREQDSTDFEKALSRLAAPLILAVGFTAGRLDHELAVYNALLRYPEQRCIVIGAQDICFLSPAALSLTLPESSRISLFPLAPCRVSAAGVKWPLQQQEMAADGLVSVSNQVQSAPVRVQVTPRKLLVILPRERLKAAVDALTQTAL